MTSITLLPECPWLEPEETTQYDFGTTWSLIRRSGWFRGVDVQGDFYFNQVDNKIVAMAHLEPVQVDDDESGICGDIGGQTSRPRAISA